MIFHRRWVAWGIAAAVAAALNLLLFALIPYLLSADPEKPEYEQIVSGISVIRMPEPEPEEPRPIEQPEKEERPEPEAAASRPEPVEMQMQLPFEINPRLPAGPQTIELPPMMARDMALSQKTFSAGDLDQPLTAVSRMPPVYPMSAKRRNIEGWVNVRFVVNEEGEVENVSILEEQPPGVFDRAVIDCVSAWRFRPGTIGGIPVRTVAETTIRFELD